MCSEDSMKYLVLVLFSFCFFVYGEERVCSQDISSNKYAIDELNFTENNYTLAIKSLKIASEVKAYDWDFYDVESDLMYVKGYMFKLHLQQQPKNLKLRNEFCDFLKNEAYARHE
jgi:hypothetical protein